LENYIFNPYKEDLAKVREYQQIVIDLYKDKKETSVTDNYQMWKRWGGGGEILPRN